MAVSRRPHWLYSQRLSIVGALLATFALLGAGQYFGARRIYTSSLEQSEQHDELLRARHAQALFNATLDELKRQSWDNATWDDAVDYVEGRRPDFVSVNLGPSVYDTHNSDLIAILRPDFTVLTTLAFDARHSRTIAPPPEFRAALAPDADIARFFEAHSPGGGFVRFGGENYVVGTAPVLNNGGLGQPRGWFVALRRIDAAYAAFLAERIGAVATVRVAADIASDLGRGRTPLAQEDIRFTPVSDERLDTRFVLSPIGAGQHLEVTLSTPRTVHAAAVHGARSLLVSTLIVGALATLLALWFIDQRLLYPMRLISQRLRRIGDETLLSERLPESARRDEIGQLAETINAMLGRIEEHENQTHRSRDAALTASRIKSEFVARMSHEIRTPMNGVLGMTELLQRTELNERQRKFCETIHRSGTSLLDIVNDILDFSKMEAGRMMLQPTTFSLQDVVDDVAELLAPRAHAKSIELIVATADNVPSHVTADPLRLSQILTNLVGNAIKFTERGQILVRLREVARGAEESTLEFSVEDTGVGIAESACATIFESFTQADNADDLALKGTGLGLAIAKQLVELMRGRIAVTSEVGRGSTFTFTITAGRPDHALVPALPPDLFAGRRLLIGDDNPSARAGLVAALGRLGAEVTGVATAPEVCAALAASGATPFDAVLIDHALRDPEVLARLEALRTMSLSRGPRVVLLSPVQGAAAGLIAELNSVDAYLTKPVRHSLLVATIARLLAVRGVAAIPDPMATGEYTAHRRLIGLRVLVVEDNAVNREVAVGMLGALGCVVSLAVDGNEALEVLEREEFDVILMDWQMPRRDGIATTLELRRREAARRRTPTPVIALTAHALPGSREACLKAGMNEFLLKPFSLSELSRTIARCARHRPTPRAAPFEGAGEGTAERRAPSGVEAAPAGAPRFVSGAA